MEFINSDTCFAITVNQVGSQPADFALYEDDGLTTAYAKSEQNQIVLHLDSGQPSVLRSGNYHGPARFKIAGWKAF